MLTTGPTEIVGSAHGDSAFFAHMDRAITLGEAAVEKNPDDASARFFLGGAYGYEARTLALQEKWWDAYRKGKKGVEHLERVVKERPDFADAYLGLGIYHYYADVLPSVLKFFGTFVGMNGDKTRGLEEIRRSLREGVLVGEEARFFLAEIETSFEEDHETALGFSRSLRDEFPENELFAWLNARVLDELHLADLAEKEWSWLEKRAKGASQRGFIAYRLVRTRLYSGDFAGAADELGDLLRKDALGSRRISMWARIRRGMALDFLGRHDEAIGEYRYAREMKASTSAGERAEERIAAANHGTGTLALLELQEMVRILRDTGTHGERELSMLEEKLVGPSRGLSKSEKALYYEIARDLAETRIRRGDPAACNAVLDRIVEKNRDVPKEERAKNARLEARALVRMNRTDDAIRELKSARSKADWETREAIDRDRAILQRRNPGTAPAAPLGSGSRALEASDRAELTLEIEVEAGGGSRSVFPMRLESGRWSGSLPPFDGDVRARFVADGHARHIDPHAPRVVIVGDEAWGLYPKQTNSLSSP